MPIDVADLDKPFDPTNYNAITGAQLQQLIDGIVPHKDSGLVKWSLDVAGVPVVPNAGVTTKWQRYLWIRVTAAGVVIYQWNPYITPDATLLNWQPILSAGIPPGSITNAQLTANCVNDANITALSYAKLTSAPASLPPSGVAGGVLAGTFPSPTFNLAGLAELPVGAIIIPAASPGLVCRIKSDGSVPEFGQQGVIQRAFVNIAGLVTSNVAVTNGAMTVAQGTQLATVAFTPVSNNSNIRLKLVGSMLASQNTVNSFANFAIFNVNALVAYAWAYYNGAPTLFTSNQAIEAIIASWGAGVAHNIQARFGTTNGGGAQLAQFGAANNNGTFMVEEFF